MGEASGCRVGNLGAKLMPGRKAQLFLMLELIALVGGIALAVPASSGAIRGPARPFPATIVREKRRAAIVRVLTHINRAATYASSTFTPRTGSPYWR